MPVRRITVTESFAEIDPGERRARVDYATIPGAGWSRARLDRLRDALQASIDLGVPLAALPGDDPDSDPPMPAGLEATFPSERWGQSVDRSQKTEVSAGPAHVDRAGVVSGRLSGGSICLGGRGSSHAAPRPGPGLRRRVLPREPALSKQRPFRLHLPRRARLHAAARP